MPDMSQRLLVIALLPAVLLGAGLFRDDFSRFPPGHLSQPRIGRLFPAQAEKSILRVGIRITTIPTIITMLEV